MRVSIPSTGSPSDEELLDLAKIITVEWYQLSIRLDLGLGAISDILGDLRFVTPSEKAFQALVVWRNSFTSDNAIYEKLANGLRKVDRQDLVQKFCIDKVNI